MIVDRYGADQIGCLSQTQTSFRRTAEPERASAGLTPVFASRTLIAVGRAHSEDMRTKMYFSHTNLEGSDPFMRMARAGYRYNTAAENIAQGQRTPQQVMTSWMNSDGHRRNILNGNLRELGVGLSSAGFYWTQVFGSPTAACGNGFLDSGETCDTGGPVCAACASCRLAAGSTCSARTELEAGQNCCGGAAPPPSATPSPTPRPTPRPTPPPPTQPSSPFGTPSPPVPTLEITERPSQTPAPNVFVEPTAGAPGEQCRDILSCDGCVGVEQDGCKWCKFTAGANKCIPRSQTCVGNAIVSQQLCMEEQPARVRCVDLNLVTTKCVDCVSSPLGCQWCPTGRRCVDAANPGQCAAGVVADSVQCAPHDMIAAPIGDPTDSVPIFFTPEQAPAGLADWLIAVIAVLACIVLCLVVAGVVMALISRKERREADELRRWAEETGSKPADFAPATPAGSAAAAPPPGFSAQLAHSTIKASRPLPSVVGTINKPLPPAPMVPLPPTPGYGALSINSESSTFDPIAAPPDLFKAASPLPPLAPAVRALPSMPTRRALPPAPTVAPVEIWATALFDFVGTEPTDLSFKEGDRLKLVDTSLSWWKGQVNGAGPTGNFPSNYAQIC
jgi:hypothetical protein